MVAEQRDDHMVDESKWRSRGSSRRSRRETKPIIQEKINHETKHIKIHENQYADKVVDVTVWIQDPVPRFKLCTERVGEVYTDTHLVHANCCAALTLRVHFAHSYACHTHAWLKGVCSAHVVISLSSHLLPSHVSPILAPAVL